MPTCVNAVCLFDAIHHGIGKVLLWIYGTCIFARRLWVKGSNIHMAYLSLFETRYHSYIITYISVIKNDCILELWVLLSSIRCVKLQLWSQIKCYTLTHIWLIRHQRIFFSFLLTTCAAAIPFALQCALGQLHPEVWMSNCLSELCET